MRFFRQANKKISADETVLEGLRDYLVDGDSIYFNYQSFSQEGEDLLLRDVFYGKKDGFYVDIGAHHPYRFSNTYFFYLQGWKGINIDPTPGTSNLFSVRDRDLTLEIGVSNTEKEMDFYIFEENALNTFDKGRVDNLLSTTPYKLRETKKVAVTTLEKIFDENLVGQQIDFISIDVEKHELEVLQSNNWNKYRPEIVLIEILDLDLENLDNPIHRFLKEKGFKLFAKTSRTCFYKDILDK